MTYYEPHLTLTEIDPVTNEWRLTMEVWYPAGETGQTVSDTVTGSRREIGVDVINNPAFRQDHLLTSTQTYIRQTGENEVVATVKKDGKKKGQGVAIYQVTGKKAA